jgi:uncharacterized protein YpmS
MMVEGMRQQTKKQTAIILLIFPILISIYIIPQVIAPATNPNQSIIASKESIESTFNQTTTLSNHLLILLSPQYREDKIIIQSIHDYQQAIKENPGWSSQLIQLTQEDNQIESIDTLIETIAQKQNLTSILLIGEDLSLPIKTTFQTISKLQLSTYATISTKSDTQKILSISLLFPTPDESYQQKQTELTKTLKRFTEKRTISLGQNATIIEQSSLSTYSKQDYTTLANTIQADYIENSNPSQFTSLFYSSHDIICIHGHGHPNNIQLNRTSQLKLTSDMAASLPTTILTIDGCYTDSIYTEKNNSPLPFISTICKSSTLHLAFYGLLSQQTPTQHANVINSILSNITSNTTIAEIINDASITFDFVFTGDPTVQFI